MAPMDLNPKDTVPIEKRTEHLVCKRCGSKVDPATGKCTDKTCGLIQRTDIQPTSEVSSVKPTGVPQVKQPGAKYQKPEEVTSTAPQYICPKCGANVGMAQGRCPNQKGCGYSGLMKQRDIQQATTSTERTITSSAPAPINYPPTAKTFLSEIEKAPETTEHYIPKTQSPMLKEIDQEESRGHGFPKRGKREKQPKLKMYSKPREWHFPSVARFVRPALASLLILIIAASLVFVAIRFIVPAASQLISNLTSPAPVASTPTLPVVGEAAPTSYTLNIGVNPQQGGSISMSPEEEVYTPDTQVTLTAIAASGYAFDHWGGDVSDVSPTTTITLTSNKSITAYFTDNIKPTISEVDVTDILDVSATVMWATSEVTTGYVEYGETEALGKTSTSSSGQATNHIAILTGLHPSTRYYFSIISKDLSGNNAQPQTADFNTGRAIATGDQVGIRAIDFTLQSYRDNTNSDSPNNPNSPYWKETISLSDFRGKTVILNFWSTYCGACLLEFPIIRDMYQKAEWANMNESPNLAVITMCIDDPDSCIVRIPKVETKFSDQIGHFLFPILLEEKIVNNGVVERKVVNTSIIKYPDKYNLHATPTTMFIDKDGIIRHVKIGAFKSTDEITSILKSL